MKKFILLLLMLSATVSYCQNDTPQREAFTLKLAVDKEQFYEVEVEPEPYFVAQKSLQLYAGDELLIEAEIAGDTIASMKVVKAIKYPERTIKIEFRQTTEDNKHDQMILSVHNPFKRQLMYDAAMFIVGHNEWVTTSIVPVFPGISGYETWHDVIISLVLHSWRFE